MLAEEPADPAAAGPAAQFVQAAFREYLDALTEWGGATVRLEDLPDEPDLLSFIVAAAMVVDLPERQALLAEPDHPAQAGPGTCPAVPGDRHAAHHHLPACPGPQEHAVQPELGEREPAGRPGQVGQRG